jgi:hypothetical protein
VEVASEGEAMIAKAVREPINDEPRLSISHAGEYYRINCPFCNDTRFRLYVSHRYGQRDAFGRRMTFLATCFNETACMSRPENQLDFREMLESVDGVLERAELRRGVIVPEEAREIQWPGPCTRLDDLRDGHPARAYVELDRHFDADKIARMYGVSYCHNSHYFLARNRLLIPVYQDGKLKGWQARHIGELRWKDKGLSLPPKYFSYPGMPRRQLLYNFDRAREYATGVIVEGPTDVWAFGGMATCTFGAAMADPQLDRFLAVFRRRTAVLLYDPEAMETKPVVRLIERLRRRMPGRFAAVTLPKKTDPGSLGRRFLRDYVQDEAAAQGVEVSYARWDDEDGQDGARGAAGRRRREEHDARARRPARRRPRDD